MANGHDELIDIQNAEWLEREEVDAINLQEYYRVKRYVKTQANESRGQEQQVKGSQSLASRNDG